MQTRADNHITPKVATLLNDKYREPGKVDQGPWRPSLSLSFLSLLKGITTTSNFLLKPGLTGVCGVLSYKVELDSEEDAEYLQVMFSVPYNLNNYDSYLAVGVSGEYLNSSDGGLFRTFYYYSGSFERAQAGRMAEYQSEHSELSMPYTYKEVKVCYPVIYFQTVQGCLCCA